MMVSYQGAERDYYKMSHGERQAYDEGQRFASQVQSRDYAKQARADAEASIRALPADVKARLYNSGYRGDISSLPPGESSGILKKTEGRTKAGHWIEKYEGDPREWMNQFSPPMKMRMIAIRTDGMSEQSWNQTRENALRYRASRNDDVGRAAAAELNLMSAFRSSPS